MRKYTHNQVDVDDHSDKHARANAKERHANLLDGETVLAEDDGEGLECQVEDTEHDGTPHVERKIHSVEKQELLNPWVNISRYRR